MNEDKPLHNDNSSQETQQWWPVVSLHHVHDKPQCYFEKFHLSSRIEIYFMYLPKTPTAE